MSYTGPKPQRQRSKADLGEATRADLIAAGRRLFGQRGYDGASIRAITNQAGVNLGAVTYHFGSKRALYAAVLEQGLRPIASRVQSVANSEGTALERILRVVEAYFEHFEAHPDLPHLLLQEVAAGKQPPPVVLDILRSVKDAIAGLQLEGDLDGSVRPGDPVLTALSVVSQPIYLALVAPLLRALGPVDLSLPPTRRVALQHILAFVRAGLTPAGNQLTP
ncbi:MAG: TetR/AcrR family transcriptional regulator [Longimicrobiales bacterium]